MQKQNESDELEERAPPSSHSQKPRRRAYSLPPRPANLIAPSVIVREADAVSRASSPFSTFSPGSLASLLACDFAPMNASALFEGSRRLPSSVGASCFDPIPPRSPTRHAPDSPLSPIVEVSPSKERSPRSTLPTREREGTHRGGGIPKPPGRRRPPSKSPTRTRSPSPASPHGGSVCLMHGTALPSSSRAPTRSSPTSNSRLYVPLSPNTPESSPPSSPLKCPLVQRQGDSIPLEDGATTQCSSSRHHPEQRNIPRSPSRGSSRNVSVAPKTGGCARFPAACDMLRCLPAAVIVLKAEGHGARIMCFRIAAANSQAIRLLGCNRTDLRKCCHYSIPELTEPQRMSRMIEVLARRETQVIGPLYLNEKAVRAVAFPLGSDTSIGVVFEELDGGSSKMVRLEHMAGRAITEGVAIVDTRFSTYPITYVNGGFEDLTGYMRDEVLCKSLRDALQGELTSADSMSRIEKALNEGSTLSGEAVLLYRKDGSTFWSDIRMVPSRDDDEQLVHYTIIMRDVTKHMVREQQIREEKDRADAATSAKSEFVAHISHELRTPLTQIVGLSELLTYTETTPLQHEYAQGINESCNAILFLVDDILDFSKIEARCITLEHRPYVVGEIVENALEMVSVRASRKNLNLVQQVSEDVPKVVVGDAHRTRQCLLNFISNAVKFTKEGEITVTVNAKFACDDEKRCELHFSVRDTGPGITKEALGRMFRSFSQATISTTREYGGTGLGLSITKSLANMMGGDAWVESKEGVGSCFHFTVVAPVGECELYESPRVSFTTLRGRRALVVLTGTINSVISSQLSTLGMGVTSRMTIEEGLNDWNASTVDEDETEFDIVFVDMQIPDALSLAEHVVKSPATRLVLVTFLTRINELETESPEVFKKASHLTKPIKQANFHKILVEAFHAEDFPSPACYASEAPEGPNPGPACVLLVEDNETSAKIILRIMETLGHTVSWASNGHEALSLFENAENKYDIIFTDINMPIMDGYELAKQIRRLDPDGSVSIIALTADARKEIQDRCWEAGMDDFVTKPAARAKLKSLIDERMACQCWRE